MVSTKLVDKIQGALMSKKQQQYKLFHNCILAIEEGDVKKVEQCVSLYPKLPNDKHWANKKTEISNLGLFQLCVPLDRAACPQKITHKHSEIVKFLLKNGADPFTKATQYYEGPRVIDKLIANAFLPEKRSQLKDPSSPLRKVLNEVLHWMSERHNLEDALNVGAEWRSVSRKAPKLCKEILNTVQASKNLETIRVESVPLQSEEKNVPQTVRHLKI